MSAAITGTVLALALVTKTAAAYCVRPSVATLLQGEFPSLRIPVYISTGTNSSIEHTGVSQQDAARIIVEVIARYNETITAPKLYFAGFSANDYNPVTLLSDHPMMSWGQGITIQSFECGLLDDANYPNFYMCNAHSSNVKACAARVENKFGQVAGFVNLVPTDCDLAASSRMWNVDGSSDDDLAHTFLHEIGHVIGLEHTNRTSAECTGGGNVAGNNPSGNSGVMRTTNGASLSRFRHWRRDDLDGIDHLWSAYYPNYEIAYWSDDAFPNFPAIPSASSLSGALVSRSASLADTPAGAPQALATLDDNRRVMFATLADDGSVSEGPTPIDLSPLGVTAGSPEIALGGDGNNQERVFVAWTANEHSDSELMQTRWAQRDLAGGAWALTEGFNLTTSRVVAGFDPTTHSWLLGTLSTASTPLVSVIDYDGTLLVGAASLGDVTAWEIGDPVCGHGSGCTMLFSTSELGGPSLGRIDFRVDGDPATVFVESMTIFQGQDVYGRTSLAPADPGVFRGVAGWQRFEMGTAPNASPDPIMPPLFALRDWPLGLGSYTNDQASRSHRLAMPLEIECGNGIVQASQECDDGNLQPNDGCDDMCTLELEDTGDTGDTEDTGETEGPVIEGDGCQCGIEREGDRRGLPLLWLSGWGLVSWRRRRAQSTL